MKKHILSKVLSIALASAFVLSGCSSTPPAGNPKNPAPSAAAPADTGKTSGKKTDVVIGTAGTSGTYYVVAAAMAQAITNHSDTLNVIAQPTKGSIENINLANSGDIQFGMSNADGVFFAYNGEGSYEKAGKQNVLGLMSLYMSAGQMAVKKGSGIKSYGDMKGKKVCLGPPSTTIVEMSKAILRAYSIDPEKDIKPYYLAFDEGLQKLTDGEIDACFFVAGIPTAALINASSTGSVELVDVDTAILDKISAEMPYFEKFKIPAGTYKGIDKDINTLKIYTEIFVNKDVSDDVAYEFVKQALKNINDYKDAHVVCKEITPETAAKTSAALHPGAEKYYKEIGVVK